MLIQHAQNVDINILSDVWLSMGLRINSTYF